MQTPSGSEYKTLRTGLQTPSGNEYKTLRTGLQTPSGNEIHIAEKQRVTLMDNQKKTIKILVIEDNPVEVLMIQNMLEKAEDVSLCMKSAMLMKEGLDHLDKGVFDVILLDLGLPDSPRGETFDSIYAQAQNTPIIVLTGYDDEAFAVKAIQSGAQDYLIKGQVNFNSLARSVRYAIERNRSEKALRESKEQWERTFNAISDIIAILDPDMRIVRTNQAAAEASGICHETLIGKYCYEVFLNKSDICQDCHYEKGCQDVREAEYVYLGRTFHVSLSPIFDENKTPVGFVYVIKDISDKKKMEVQLRQAQRMEAIATLAGGIAHDLNNILFPIFGYAEMTSAIAGEDGVIRKNMKRVLEAAERARSMVQQVLTFSRQRHEDEKERKPWKIQPIIKEVLKLLRGSFPSTIDIRRNINEKCGPTLADPTRIHQVIMNLCTNAYHAMREKGGVLEVALDEVVINSDDSAFYPDTPPGSYLKLSVSDTGHGMEKSVMEKIFDPYFTTKDEGEGTGLGLAVVHKIVKDHHGCITVYSEPDQGTMLHVYLPLMDTRTVELATATSPAPAVPGGRERILLVDDDEAIAEMLRHLLGSLGYQVTSLTSSPEALSAFRSAPADFDLVITDMTMPGMTGAELSKTIRCIRADIPIILCTGFSELMTKEDAKAMGIQRYLMKPVSKREIAEAIREVLDAKSSLSSFSRQTGSDA